MFLIFNKILIKFFGARSICQFPQPLCFSEILPLAFHAPSVVEQTIQTLKKPLKVFSEQGSKFRASFLFTYFMGKSSEFKTQDTPEELETYHLKCFNRAEIS